MGSRLSPRRDRDSPRNPQKWRCQERRSTHESTLAGHTDGKRTSDQMVGGSNPSGRASTTTCCGGGQQNRYILDPWASDPHWSRPIRFMLMAAFFAIAVICYSVALFRSEEH